MTAAPYEMPNAAMPLPISSARVLLECSATTACCGVGTTITGFAGGGGGTTSWARAVPAARDESEGRGGDTHQRMRELLPVS